MVTYNRIPAATVPSHARFRSVAASATAPAATGQMGSSGSATQGEMRLETPPTKRGENAEFTIKKLRISPSKIGFTIKHMHLTIKNVDLELA